VATRVRARDTMDTGDDGDDDAEDLVIGI